ncbi:MAG: hypothetical protein ACYDC6_15095 [Acidobacteriaceae bacterium]
MTTKNLPALLYNRHVLLLKPRQPFLDWLKSDPMPPSLTLDQLREDCTAYLIPEFDTNDAAEKWVMKRWRWFFEETLHAWIVEPDLWPDKLTPKTFTQFFDMEIHSMVMDVSGKELEVDDMGDDSNES